MLNIANLRLIFLTTNPTIFSKFTIDSIQSNFISILIKFNLLKFLKSSNFTGIRSPATNLQSRRIMEKGNYVFQKYRVCILVSFSSIFWIILLFFHFRVYDHHHINPYLNLSYIPENPKNNECDGKYIFVHNLPSKFNEDIIRNCETINKWFNMCKFVQNSGLGPELKNIENMFSMHGWHETNQFTVDLIFYNRMKQYKCLTNDSKKAAAVFVPFFAGFDVSRYLWGYNVSVRDSRSLELIEWLRKRAEWKVMNGKDHFLVGGRITWDFRRLSDLETDWGNKLLLFPAFKNISMLVIESSPWDSNDFAIPYPSYFHPSKDEDVFKWQHRVMKSEREWLFCFAGGPRPGDPKSIRNRLIGQIKNSSFGKLLECGIRDTHKCNSPNNVMKMFQNSVFCLQPQGDSYTRRSAFDAILAGCIPVFFHPGSFYTQYTWHLPKNYTKYSVFIPEDDIRNNVSVENRLRKIGHDKIRRMRYEVINMIPRLIYADPRFKLETLKDAFDVTIDAIIKKVAKERRDMVNGNSTNGGLVEEVSWKYALLEEGENVGVHEWDPFFSKPKPKPKPNNGINVDLQVMNRSISEQKVET